MAFEKTHRNCKITVGSDTTIPLQDKSVFRKGKNPDLTDRS
jgi:hypothetical protein